MHIHGPNLLQGPISRHRGWWNVRDEDTIKSMSNMPPNNDANLNAASRNPRPADAPIRTDLVERVRREIAEGTYETPEKWEAALDRLCKRLQEE